MADENGSGDADAPSEPTADDETAAPEPEEDDEHPVDGSTTDDGEVDAADTDGETGDGPTDAADTDGETTGPVDRDSEPDTDAADTDSEPDTDDDPADGSGSDPDPADAPDTPGEDEEGADGWEDTWTDGTAIDTETGAAGTEAETDADTEAGTDAETGAETDAETGAEVGTDTDADTGGEVEAETIGDGPPASRASTEVTTTGAAPAGATAAGAGGGSGAPGGAVSAPDDQEMPLADHIEEMVARLGVVVIAMALVSGVVFPFADRFINFLWYSFLPGTIEQCPTPPADVGPNEVACPTLYHPLALMFARLKLASLAGFVVALPVMVYESYLFMRPGLYPRERRYYLASVPTSLILACVGVVFAYFLVLPVLFQYFTGYTASAADIAFGLSETFNLIVMMLGFFALIFQIPLLVMLAIMMGVTSREWLADKRLYFWGGFATVAFIFSPDPTGMAPILVAVTMIGLFEGTLLLLRWTGN